MYNCILVPTDGSAGTGRVVDHASALARVHGADLHFLYVVNTASFANLPMETSWESVTTMLREEGESALAAAEERAGVDRVVTAIVEGPPSREIVEYAKTEGCDLIVMGTHGRGGLNRLLLGSVAERVVRSSPVPVMTVRVTEDADDERPAEAAVEADETDAGTDEVHGDAEAVDAEGVDAGPDGSTGDVDVDREASIEEVHEPVAVDPAVSDTFAPDTLE